MNRKGQRVLCCLIAATVTLTPAAAGASDENFVDAINQTDGAAVVEASVQYRKSPNGRVDEKNRARAFAQCTGCQTLAAAFQLVLITTDWDTFTPYNEAFVANIGCVECVSWAEAKQVLVETGGPAELSESGHSRLRALERRLNALEAEMPGMSLEALKAAVDAAFMELLAIAREEIVRTDGGPEDAEIVAVLSA